MARGTDLSGDMGSLSSCKRQVWGNRRAQERCLMGLEMARGWGTPGPASLPPCRHKHLRNMCLQMSSAPAHLFTSTSPFSFG